MSLSYHLKDSEAETELESKANRHHEFEFKNNVEQMQHTWKMQATLDAHSNLSQSELATLKERQDSQQSPSYNPELPADSHMLHIEAPEVQPSMGTNRVEGKPSEEANVDQRNSSLSKVSESRIEDKSASFYRRRQHLIGRIVTKSRPHAGESDYSNNDSHHTEQQFVVNLDKRGTPQQEFRAKARAIFAKSKPLFNAQSDIALPADKLLHPSAFSNNQPSQFMRSRFQKQLVSPKCVSLTDLEGTKTKLKPIENNNSEGKQLKDSSEEIEQAVIKNIPNPLGLRSRSIWRKPVKLSNGKLLDSNRSLIKREESFSKQTDNHKYPLSCEDLAPPSEKQIDLSSVNEEQNNSTKKGSIQAINEPQVTQNSLLNPPATVQFSHNFCLKSYSSLQQTLQELHLALKSAKSPAAILTELKHYFSILAEGRVDSIDQFDIPLQKRKIIRQALFLERVVATMVGYSLMVQKFVESHKYVINLVAYALSTGKCILKTLELLGKENASSQPKEANNRQQESNQKYSNSNISRNGSIEASSKATERSPSPEMNRFDRLAMKKAFDQIRTNNDSIIDSSLKICRSDLDFAERVKLLMKQSGKSPLHESFFSLLNFLALYMCEKNLDSAVPFLAIAPNPYLPSSGETSRYSLIIDLVQVCCLGSRKSKTHIYRPFTQHFLQEMGRNYQMIAFVDLPPSQANRLIDLIDSKGVFSHRLFRQHASNRGNRRFLHLERLGRLLNRTAFLTSPYSDEGQQGTNPSAAVSPGEMQHGGGVDKQSQEGGSRLSNYSSQGGNANEIYVPIWRGNKSDLALIELCSVLASIPIKHLDASEASAKIQHQISKNKREGIKYLNFDIQLN